MPCSIPGRKKQKFLSAQEIKITISQHQQTLRKIAMVRVCTIFVNLTDLWHNINLKFN
jgi:hypothetical protein